MGSVGTTAARAKNNRSYRRVCVYIRRQPGAQIFSSRHYCLARSAKLPTGLYVFALISSFLFFLIGAKLSQYLLDRFSRSFHQMEGICVNFLDQVQFFQFLKGRCHDNQFCVVAVLFARSRSISASTGPIFTIFAPLNGR